MAKVTITNQFSWMRFVIKFDDKTKMTAKFNRAGTSLTVDPSDAGLEKKLGIILSQNSANMTRDNGWNLGKTFEVVEDVAPKARTPEEFLNLLAEKLGVSGEMPKPKDAPESAKSEFKKSRGGHVIKAHFPSGEEVELTINRSSVGARVKPDIPGPDEKLINLVFSVKELMGGEELAWLMTEKARSSVDVADWCDQVKSAFAPSMKR